MYSGKDKEFFKGINWLNAILWTMALIIIFDWIGVGGFEFLYPEFGFWITSIFEFLFVLLIMLCVDPPGVRNKHKNSN